MHRGSFWRDLFYRLNIIPLGLPLLSRHFLGHYAAEFRKEIDDIAGDAMQRLMCHDWPGNVRELENIMQRAVVVSTDRVLQGGDVDLPMNAPFAVAESFQAAKARVVTQFEKNYIHGLLVSHGGNITKAARTAGKNRRAFWELIRKHEIDVESFRRASS